MWKLGGGMSSKKVLCSLLQSRTFWKDTLFHSVLVTIVIHFFKGSNRDLRYGLLVHGSSLSAASPPVFPQPLTMHLHYPSSHIIGGLGVAMDVGAGLHPENKTNKQKEKQLLSNDERFCQFFCFHPLSSQNTCLSATAPPPNLASSPPGGWAEVGVGAAQCLATSVLGPQNLSWAKRAQRLGDLFEMARKKHP